MRHAVPAHMHELLFVGGGDEVVSSAHVCCGVHPDLSHSTVLVLSLALLGQLHAVWILHVLPI